MKINRIVRVHTCVHRGITRNSEGGTIGESLARWETGSRHGVRVRGGHCIKYRQPFASVAIRSRTNVISCRALRGRRTQKGGKRGGGVERKREERRKKDFSEIIAPNRERPIAIVTTGERENFPRALRFFRVARLTYTRINAYVYVIMMNRPWHVPVLHAIPLLPVLGFVAPLFRRKCPS